MELTVNSFHLQYPFSLCRRYVLSFSKKMKTKMFYQQYECTTMGFVQVWLDVVAIGISNIAAFVRAGKASLNISSYYLTLSKAKQRFRAEGILLC